MNRRDLNPDESPGAAFGARLRSSREEHGWIQDELAERMGYSGTHVSAIETHRKSPTLPFARRADEALGTGREFERMWRKVHHAALLEGFPAFVEHEARAAEIRLFELGIIPGLLQTPDYAAAIAAGAVRRGSITDQQARERVLVVEERQAALQRSPPPLVHVVLDESCIRRLVGGSVVMTAQLDRLVEFAELQHTALQVTPFDLGERRAFDLPVTVLTLPDRSLKAYAESAQQGYLERDNTFVLPLLTAYYQLQNEALSQAASVAMIRQAGKGTP